LLDYVGEPLALFEGGTLPLGTAADLDWPSIPASAESLPSLRRAIAGWARHTSLDAADDVEINPATHGTIVYMTWAVATY
jgi:hypothetical protein